MTNGSPGPDGLSARPGAGTQGPPGTSPLVFFFLTEGEGTIARLQTASRRAREVAGGAAGAGSAEVPRALLCARASGWALPFTGLLYSPRPGLGDAWGQPSRAGPLDSVAKELGSHLLQVEPPRPREERAAVSGPGPRRVGAAF